MDGGGEVEGDICADCIVEGYGLKGKDVGEG